MTTTHDPAEVLNAVTIGYNRATHSLMPIFPVRADSIPIEASKLKDLENVLPQLHSESMAYYSTLIAEERLRAVINLNVCLIGF